MSDVTKIQWADHTWSPWFGCAKVSAGCTNCYAEADNARYKRNGGGWGKGAPRVLSKGWDKPRKWNRAAEKAQRRERVFPSLCDPWDQEVAEQWRVALFDLIGHTPWLDYLLLTKRIEHVGARYLPLPNVWVGTSVENAAVAHRIDALRNVQAAVRFISFEPLIASVGAVDLTGIHWAIIGGESGRNARPCDLQWIRELIAQCREQNVAVFVKQLGARPFDSAAPLWSGKQMDAKGGDFDDPNFPRDLRVREMPVMVESSLDVKGSE